MWNVEEMEHLSSIFMQSKLSCYQHKILYYSYNVLYEPRANQNSKNSDVDAQNFKWKE